MEVSSQMGPFSIVPEWVLDRGLSPTALKLYIVMARFADWNTGVAFPSRETLAKRMNCSLKTVDRAVIEIVAAECVGKISRGRYTSALYRVYQVDPRGTDVTSEWTDLTNEGTDLSSRLDRNDDITITTKREPTKREPLNKAFDTFWAIYPLKKDKPAAKRAFEKALKRADLETIVAGAERYRDDPNREQEFTKYPQGWLSNDAWDNPPETPRGRKLTNAENAALLHQKIVAQEQAKQREIESGDIDFGGMLRGVE